MRKTYAFLAVSVLVTATQASRAQVEILPLPRTDGMKSPPSVESAPAPVVSASHSDHHDASHRQRLDEWIMYQPLHHPHVCSTCLSGKAVPCCDPPGYTFFLARCANTPAGCAGAALPEHPAGSACVEHPILSFWQSRVCCMRSSISGAVENFKMSATCPVCGKRTYLALWHLHECSPEECQAPPPAPEVKTCSTASGDQKKVFFALWRGRETAKSSSEAEPRAVLKDGGHPASSDVAPGKAK